MKIVIQRVKRAKVTVSGQVAGEIKRGLLLLVGVGEDDRGVDIEHLSKKIANMRIFDDKEGKMNLDIKQVNGEVLSVPQFTLYADVQKGNRPGFDSAAKPDAAKGYWGRFNMMLKACGVDVKEGVFGAHMEVESVNDGPVTIYLDK